MNLRQTEICGPPGMLSPHFRKEGAGVGDTNLALKVSSRIREMGWCLVPKGRCHIPPWAGVGACCCVFSEPIYSPLQESPSFGEYSFPHNNTQRWLPIRGPHPWPPGQGRTQLRTTKSLPCGLSHQNQRTTVNQETCKARTTDDHGSRPWKEPFCRRTKK